MVRLFLKYGANVNAANTFGGKVKHGDIALQKLTPLMFAAAHSPVEVVEELIRAGTQVNATDVRGMTPLMLAVSSNRQDSRVVAGLLKAGADTSAKDIYGQTALDWAMKFRHPKVLAMLGGKSSSDSSSGAVAGKTNSPPLVEELTQTVSLLQKASESFFKESGCVACHHQNLTAMAVSAARAKSLPVDEKAEGELMQATKIGWDSIFKHGMLVRDDPPGGVDMTIYALWSLAAENADPSDLTDTMVHNIAVQQWGDGRWELTGIARAPLTEGAFLRTAKAIYLIDRYAPKGMRTEMDGRIARARQWLVANQTLLADEQAMRLAGLIWSRGPQAHVVKATRSLTKLQRPDGGWGSSEYLPTDPLTTAQAIYALKLAGVSSHNHAIRDGINYLRRTRKPDGSWYVASRSPKFQPYFESGFPYGHDQWLAVSATDWAVTALAETMPSPVRAAAD